MRRARSQLVPGRPVGPGMGVTLSQRQAVTKTNAARYRRVDRAGKGTILDKLCATTRWHRSHASNALARASASRRWCGRSIPASASPVLSSHASSWWLPNPCLNVIATYCFSVAGDQRGVEVDHQTRQPATGVDRDGPPPADPRVAASRPVPGRVPGRLQPIQPGWSRNTARSEIVCPPSANSTATSASTGRGRGDHALLNLPKPAH